MGDDLRDVYGRPLRGVHQTKFGEPAGNCHMAAIATLLGEQLEHMPGLQANSPWYLSALETWLREKHGLATLRLMLPQPSIWTMGDVMHLASGEGPRGCRHTVVMRNGAFVWDPHPSDNGLVGVDTYWYFVKFGATRENMNDDNNL